MLNNVLANLPKKEFIKADLNDVLETRIVENRQPVKACMDILEHHFQYVKSGKIIAAKQYYEMTPLGKKAQEKIKKKVIKRTIKLKI